MTAEANVAVPETNGTGPALTKAEQDAMAETAQPVAADAAAEPLALPEPDDREKMPRFGNPRTATVSIVRERLERMLQPVETDDVWHGVNVITAKDLDEAVREPLPPASIFAASVRTPAFIYVDAVCPNCGIAGEISLEVDAKLTVVGQGRKLALSAKAATMAHQCGQTRISDLGPSRPVKGQTALDLGDGDGEDLDPLERGDDQVLEAGEGAELAETESASPAEVRHEQLLHDLPTPAPLTCKGSNHVPGHSRNCPQWDPNNDPHGLPF